MVAIKVSSRKIIYFSRRIYSKKAYYFFICVIAFFVRKLDILPSLATTLYKPLFYKNTLRCLDAEKWKLAIQSKLDFLVKNNT